jgi:hypothetical protein
VAGGSQRQLWFAELRVYDNRVARAQPAGDEDERLRGARCEQYLLQRSVMACGHGGASLSRVGVGR